MNFTITPNQRLAFHLKQTQANVFAIEDWVKTLWQNSNSNKTLLTDLQESLVWENIIAQKNSDALININNVIKEIKAAWQLVQKWDIKLSDWPQYLTDDSVFFLDLAKTFITTCESNNWIDQQSILSELVKHFENFQKLLPKKLILAGFDQITPQLKNFLDCLITRSINVEYFNPNVTQNSNQKRIACPDEDTEIAAMALWAKNCSDKNPYAQIACIVPDIVTLRSKIENYFDKVNPNNFDISLGKPFYRYPIIMDALKILSSINHQFNLLDLNRVLHSPFIEGGDIEFAARSMLDKKLRESGEPMIPFRTLLATCKDSTKNYYCPILAAKIDKCYVEFKNVKPLQSFSAWTKYFAKQLEIIGWPQTENLSDYEKQVIKRWQVLLDEFANLSFIKQTVSIEHAISRLNHLTENIIFQPIYSKCKITSDQLEFRQVKILGLLEAAGLNFDYLWIMGLDDSTYPSKPKTNQFIPIQLQKKYNLPHATFERELEFCSLLLERISHSSPIIICSYPTSRHDYILRPSPLIKNIPECSFENLDLTQDELLNIEFTGWQPKVKPELITEQAPAINDNEKISGGSKIIKLQAQCPFRAYAECRLNAVPLDYPHFGLDAKERGQLIHNILEKFWHIIQDQQNLLNRSNAEIEAILDSIISNILLKLNTNKPTTLTKQLVSLEIRRLKKILGSWLDIEKNRSEFVVLSQEKWQSLNIGKLKLKLRIDRIDRLKDGSLIIIDYKTGDINPSDWFGDRPTDPQLPLYCIASKHNVKGLLIAQIKTGKLRFMGITNNDYQIPGIKVANDWDELLKNWLETINNLAKDFESGKANVDPKDGNACRYCKLQGLCRIPNF